LASYNPGRFFNESKNMTPEYQQQPLTRREKAEQLMLSLQEVRRDKGLPETKFYIATDEHDNVIGVGRERSDAPDTIHPLTGS
jgi:hypothetical protein